MCSTAADSGYAAPWIDDGRTDGRAFLRSDRRATQRRQPVSAIGAMRPLRSRYHVAAARGVGAVRNVPVLLGWAVDASCLTTSSEGGGQLRANFKESCSVPRQSGAAIEQHSTTPPPVATITGRTTPAPVIESGCPRQRLIPTNFVVVRRTLLFTTARSQNELEGPVEPMQRCACRRRMESRRRR